MQARLHNELSDNSISIRKYQYARLRNPALLKSILISSAIVAYLIEILRSKSPSNLVKDIQIIKNRYEIQNHIGLTLKSIIFKMSFIVQIHR